MTLWGKNDVFATDKIERCEQTLHKILCIKSLGKACQSYIEIPENRCVAGRAALGKNEYLCEKMPTDDPFLSVFLGQRQDSRQKKRTLTTRRGIRKF